MRDIKIQGQGKLSRIAEYLYYNNLIPEFDEWIETQKEDINKKAQDKGYSCDKILYIVYIEVREDDGTIKAEMEGYETEQWINFFLSYKPFLKYDYVTKTGWRKEHQPTILQLFQEAEIHYLLNKLKEYEDEEDD